MKAQRAGIGLAMVVVVVLAAVLGLAPARASGGEPPTPLPEDRGWFSAVPLAGPFVSPLPATAGPSYAAVAAAYQPEVYDLSGLPRDWDWIHNHYGNTQYVPTAGTPRFILRRVDATVGPATIVVRVLDRNGFPAYNQPVFLSWPGIDCSQPDPNIRPIDPAYKTRIQTCGIMQRTDSNGYTGFGMSGDWYYRSGQAPGIIWVGSPSTFSDGTTGIGMLGGTNHECPCSWTFQETTGDTPTPTPVPGVTPTPSPGGTGDLTETNSLLQQILSVLQALARHLGVTQ